MGVGMDPGRDHEFAEFVDGQFTALQRFGYLLTGEWHLAEDLVRTLADQGVVPPELVAQRQRAGELHPDGDGEHPVPSGGGGGGGGGARPSNCPSRTPRSSTAPWTTATAAGAIRAVARWSCGTSKICQSWESPRS